MTFSLEGRSWKFRELEKVVLYKKIRTRLWKKGNEGFHVFILPGLFEFTCANKVQTEFPKQIPPSNMKQKRKYFQSCAVRLFTRYFGFCIRVSQITTGDPVPRFLDNRTQLFAHVTQIAIAENSFEVFGRLIYFSYTTRSKRFRPFEYGRAPFSWVLALNHPPSRLSSKCELFKFLTIYILSCLDN